MNNFFRLNVYLTLKSPDGKDITLTTSRTLPFQPVEGLVLCLPLDDGIEGEFDPEWPVTLGPPTYSYLESAFVERQEDDSLIDAVRSGDSLHEAMKQAIQTYEAYGFKRIRT